MWQAGDYTDLGQILPGIIMAGFLLYLREVRVAFVERRRLLHVAKLLCLDPSVVSRLQWSYPVLKEINLQALAYRLLLIKVGALGLQLPA